MAIGQGSNGSVESRRNCQRQRVSASGERVIIVTPQGEWGERERKRRRKIEESMHNM
jgi:hypothetical protein